MERKFKVGDRVKIIAKCDGRDLIGKTGKVIAVQGSWVKNCPIGVEFDDNISGHDCDGYGKDSHCRWCEIESLELEKKKKADKLIFRDNATILIKDGKRYVAKCCEGDTYDKEKGLLVCLAKASGYTFDDLQKMLENAEDQGQPKESKVKEVKRKAKVGEYIKIVNAEANQNKHGKGFAYKNGDILKVKELRMCGNVVTYTQKGKGSNLSYEKGYNYVYKNEYVVLENYKPNNYKITLSKFLKTVGAKVAINLKTQQEFDKFLKCCKDKGHFKGFKNDYFYIHKDKICLSRAFGYGYCDIDFYKDKGCEIYTLNEVDLNN